jgi:hypothetical protein
MGILWLLQMADIIHFSFRDFLSLWPLILVWVGIGLLPIKDGYKIGLDVVTFLIGILFLSHAFELGKREGWGFDISTNVEQTSTFHLYKNHERASLTLKAGASEINFRPGRSNLIDVHSGYNERVNMKVKENNGGDTDIDLDIMNNGFSGHTGPYSIRLHPDPVWNVTCKLGATDNMFDLSPFKVEAFNLSSGASNVMLKIGDRHPNVAIDINIGASALDISIPDNMSCEINDKAAISDISFYGFTQNSSGNYACTVPDSTSKGTIRINISAGVSDISVKRYSVN